ncbi:hypothetical protein CYMTET_49255 [Cymbomonas tetramitiformis]|uniref:Uncharacterized protein n=1 Tax=Cymbomonas tetramitiformis TaxID=36881 RepID=A0AAE0BS86_9CHLO|nr:hypothetical protein CYMTET_49255 [Cymbomonas tetramitiformis]
MLWQYHTVGAKGLASISPSPVLLNMPQNTVNDHRAALDDVDAATVSGGAIDHGPSEGSFELEEVSVELSLRALGNPKVLELVLKPYQLQVFRRGIPHWEWKERQMQKEANARAAVED